jgi:hypothetical protein
MNDGTHQDASGNAGLDLRHLAEQEQLRARHLLAEASARSAEEWFDIFKEIVATGVRQSLERNGDGIVLFDQKMAEQKPFWAKVRADLVAHGLPLSEDVEIDGPDVSRDASGAPHIVEWPRGMWVVLHWPEEGRSSSLRFEGHCALIALGFLLWWGDFHSQAKQLEGKAETPVSRIVDPKSAEYRQYMAGKAADLGKFSV